MTEKGIVCRHCGRPIAVPGSRCPWPGCGKTIMVICAACKEYTSDEGAFCEQCGEPLVAATFESPVGLGPAQSLVTDLAADKKRARLVASGVMAEHTNGFFYDGGQQRPALVDLFGAPLTPRRKAEALLFGAVAYLVQYGYATLELEGGMTPDFQWLEAKPWDGQTRSLEGQLAHRAKLETACIEALQQAVAEAVGFRLEVQMIDDEGLVVDRTTADLAALPLLKARLQAQKARSLSSWLAGTSGIPSTKVRARFDSSTAEGVIGMAWQTPLPPHEESSACQETYQMLLDFVHADPKRAKSLVMEIERVLHWFERCEEMPSLVTHEL